MATTKKTPAKKTATATKKAPTKDVEQLELPNKPEPVAPPEEEEKVSYVIPRDPSFESTDQYFEYNLNGVNYRFKRGELLTHPRHLYDAISAVLFRRERVSPYIAEFKDRSKKLN